MTVVLAMGVMGCTEVTNVLPTEPEIPGPVDCNVNPNHDDCQEVEEEPEVEISGSWQGTLSDQGGAIATAVLTMSMTQSGATFTGTWSTASGLVGSLSGAIDGGRLSGSLTITDGGGSCSGRLDGEATSRVLDALVTGLLGSCTGGYTVLDIEAAR